MIYVRLYIDPGTGSMLFAILIGLLGVARFAFKGLWVKLRFLLSGGKQKNTDNKALPLVIFADDKRYWPVFEPVIRELDSRGFDVVYMTASEDDPGLSENGLSHFKSEFIGAGNKAFAKLNFLHATILLSTTPGLDVYQWKRSKDVRYYVNMAHSPAEITTYRMFGLDYYDAVITSGQYQVDDIRKLEKMRDLPAKEMPILGLPYMDEKKKALEAAGPLGDHERTVLLAPSWGPSSLLNRFGSSIIDELIATGYHIIFRPHPQSFTSEKEMIDDLMKKYPDSNKFEWNRDTDNFDALYRSDIMLSDFSGVIFDYALVFDKPVICAISEFDNSPYDAWWLDTPTWSSKAIPRIGKVLNKEDLPNLKKMIDDCIDDSSFAENRRIARNETWCNQGKSAGLVADYLISKYEEINSIS